MLDGLGGSAHLDALELPDAYLNRIAVLPDLVDALTARASSSTSTSTSASCGDDAGYNAVHAIYGVGCIFAAVFVAEISDVTRSPKDPVLAGGTHPQAQGVHWGCITKQGSRLMR